ncbi:MAG: hypothetical protein AAGA54_00680 [Myxococcota bacterium]
MAFRSSTVLVAMALGLAACGSDDTGASSETDAGSSSTSGDTPATTSGATPTTNETASTSTDPSTAGSSETTDAAETTAVDSSTTDAPETTGDTESGACQVWEITYDLGGSTFEIRDTPLGAGDQVNTVQEPYDADANVGPGTFVLRFEDVDGAPGGLATMVSYEMSLQFTVGGVVTVATDIEGVAGPEECGVTQGLLNKNTVAWAPPQIVGYMSTGEVVCTGALCMTGGLPNGEPVDMSGTSDQPINEFVFEDDLSGFTMDEVVISSDDTSTNAWIYNGTEVSRELVDAPPCLCE